MYKYTTKHILCALAIFAAVIEGADDISVVGPGGVTSSSGDVSGNSTPRAAELAGMHIFVRKDGAVNAVELPPDATVGDLRREAGGGQLIFAGNPLRKRVDGEYQTEDWVVS